MDLSYIFTPFLAWIFAGTTKFIINSFRSKRLAFDLIGYGNLPSNHTAIVCSIVALIAIKDGIETPAFGVSIAFAFITMLDANSLRRQIGLHAKLINKLSNNDGVGLKLRESVGHTRVEIIAGAFVGCVTAFISNAVFTLIG